MRFKRGYLLIFIISVIGLAIVQVQYLRIGLNLAKVQFNEKMGLAIRDIKEGLRTKNDLTFLAEKALTKDDTYFKLSLDSVQDASQFYLKDYVSNKLLENGIQTEFTYVLFSKDSTYYLSSIKHFEKEDVLLTYPFVLEGYLPNSVKKRLILELKFKDLNNYFLFQLNGLTIPSLLFLLAIILVVMWVLKSFYWQRNLITTTNAFINNLTHELKTPVFSIGIATKILEEKSSLKDSQVIGIIRNQVDKLKNQIDTILELSTMEGKRSVLDKKLLNFQPTIVKIAKEFKDLAALENIHFSYQIKEKSYFLNGKRTHLENTLNAILDNAKKYSGEQPEISMIVYQKKKYLIIEIKDNGIGISKENKNKIFDKFYRAPSGDIHSVKGYGLGLNYVRQVLKNHKGKVSVESELGKGAIFTISLPLQNYGK